MATSSWHRYLIKYLLGQSSQSSNTRNYNLDLQSLLDHFKKVNDNFGHAAGDQILKEGSQVIKSALRKNDILCRFGGEEFIVILPNTKKEKAVELADRIRLAIENHTFNLEVEAEGEKKEVAHRQTISLGVSQLDQSMQTETDLLESADKKLYMSKQNGRNQVTS